MPDIPYKYLQDENGETFYPVTGSSSMVDPVPIAKGGTGASTAAEARANLGAQIVKIFEGNVAFTSGYGMIQASEFLYQNPIPVFGTSTYNPSLTFVFGGNVLGDRVNVGMPFATGFSGTLTLQIYGFFYD